MPLKSAPTKFTKADITKAVEILGAECFGALQLANQLVGGQTPEWEILNNNSWQDIVQEAIARGIDLKSLRCAVTKSPIMWSATIRFALGEITVEERHRIFYRDVKSNGAWTDPSIQERTDGGCTPVVPSDSPCLPNSDGLHHETR